MLDCSIIIQCHTPLALGWLATSGPSAQLICMRFMWRASSNNSKAFVFALGRISPSLSLMYRPIEKAAPQACLSAVMPVKLQAPESAEPRAAACRHPPWMLLHQHLRYASSGSRLLMPGGTARWWVKSLLFTMLRWRHISISDERVAFAMLPSRFKAVY